MKRSRLSIAHILAFGIAGITAQGTSDQSANCTAFEWDKQGAYIVTYPAQPISAAQTCPSRANESHACPLVASGDQQLTWDYNISSVLLPGFSSDDGAGPSFLFSLINASLPAANESSTRSPFVESVVGAVDAIAELRPGSSGYLQLSPYYQCYVGTMSGCTGGLSGDVGVEACSPLWHTTRTSDDMPILDGDLSVHNVSAGNVSSYPDPFAGEVRPASGGATLHGGRTAWLWISGMVAVAVGGQVLS